jgi:photosystem II stability/assembly factor-like uncharacterized protein
MEVKLLVGTVKGAFIYTRREAGGAWSVEGPLFRGWKVTASSRDNGDGFLLATASDVYGPAVHRSSDLRAWRQVERGPAYSPEDGFELKQVWTLLPAGDVAYAGVDEAGLFRSDDGGESWALVPGLTSHPTRPSWFPGFGGLCAHHLLVDPRDPLRVWVGISAVGVFQTEDGGETWETRNDGVTCVIEDESHSDIGMCVHAIVADPDDADRIWRQDHRGMYRTADGGRSWERIENGLPSGFGFPLVMDRGTKALFACPMESDEYRFPVDGALRVYRSVDGGDTWHVAAGGLPRENAYACVLRAAMSTDHLDPCGVYLGTSAGELFASDDAGDSWQRLSGTLPRILSVEAFVGD